MELEILDDLIIHKKIESIRRYIGDKRVIVAFSGGVDSTVLAYIAKLHAKEVLLILQNGDSLATQEKENAMQIAERMDLELQIITYHEYLVSENYAENPDNRCYYCKTILHGKLENIRKQMGFDIVLNGTNASDLQGHRPGYQAILESGAICPLALVGLIKSEIRWIARMAKLNVWDKPSNPCLASRVKYGVAITSELLKRVDRAEFYLRSSFQIRILRVRDDGLNATIEIGQDELHKIDGKYSIIKTRLQEMGYSSVIIDPKGYRPMKPIRDGMNN